MQVIPSRNGPRTGRALVGVASGAIVGLALLGIGAAVGYMAFGTPFVRELTPAGRPGPGQVATGAIAWALAFIAPTACLLIGFARLLDTADRALSLRRRASGMDAKLGDGYVATSRLRLPDGRIIPQLIAGPHGIAIFEDLPPRGAARRHGDRWEVRLADGRWMPIENPLERATRDAERVRRWLASDERDFVVKVHAAVIGSDTSIGRTPGCAVITRQQIPAFLASLPVQRSLTEGRLQDIVDQIRASA